MIGARLVNGIVSAAVAADDRGLQYGDGLFETMAAAGGLIRYFDLHMERLQHGCRQLQIPPPDTALIEAECMQVLEGLDSGVVKLLVTRGPGPRGYLPPDEPSVTRVVSSRASQARQMAGRDRALKLRVCEMRLGLNKRLAGIKHLNRLEQVLARAEWRDPDIDEGLMLATDGRLICATAANVFLLRDGCLLTPEIHDCGVAGIMRRVVLAAAPDLGLKTWVCDLEPEDLTRAEEVFITSAVTGIRPVGEVIGIGRWSTGKVARALAERVVEAIA